MSCVRIGCALFLMLALAACEREVTVYSSDAIGLPMQPPLTGAAGFAGFASAAGAGSVGGVGGFAAAGVAGGAIPGGAGGAFPTGAPAQVETGDDGLQPLGLLASVVQAQPMASTMLDRFEQLDDSLQSIDRPALGSAGASLPQYRKVDSVATLHVAFGGVSERWYGSTGAFRAYTAAHLERHLSLLHAEAYGIFENGAGNELSGTPATYKEFLAASAAGFAWVDYPTPVIMSPGPEARYGEVVLQPWDGARSVLSDKTRYRASVALSATHVAFVEYASTEPGSVGQVVVQTIAGGAPTVVAPSSLHQDRPAIDGDWVVFEEYLGGADSVIRARNVVTGETRELSARIGFRTHADVLGTRVVWEDQRDGNGDVYFVDLAAGSAGQEQPLISGAGHSAAPRLSSDGLVWVESASNRIGLLRARFIGAP